MTEYQELCEELYQLKPNWKAEWRFCCDVETFLASPDGHAEQEHRNYPAYTLEYLLEKLPSEGKKTTYNYLQVGKFKWKGEDVYEAVVYADADRSDTIEAETPTNAVLKLAIKLAEEEEI